jgi:hypothetical protein
MLGCLSLSVQQSVHRNEISTSSAATRVAVRKRLYSAWREGVRGDKRAHAVQCLCAGAHPCT